MISNELHNRVQEVKQILKERSSQLVNQMVDTAIADIKDEAIAFDILNKLLDPKVFNGGK